MSARRSMALEVLSPPMAIANPDNSSRRLLAAKSPPRRMPSSSFNSLAINRTFRSVTRSSPRARIGEFQATLPVHRNLQGVVIILRPRQIGNVRLRGIHLGVLFREVDLPDRLDAGRGLRSLDALGGGALGSA